MKTKIYNQEGQEKGNIELPEEIFGLKWNADLVHQVVVSIRSNKRTPVAHTKDRSDVSGGGKKPWKQKGTGRARHGSNRSPIWVGGGVTHGPRNDKSYKKKINKKMSTKALYTVLSQKLKDNRILFVDDFKFNNIKTKEAKQAMESLGKLKGFEDLSTRSKNTALITVSEVKETTGKSFRNIPGIYIENIKNINPLELLSYKYLIVSDPETSLAFLEEKINKRAEKNDKKVN